MLVGHTAGVGTPGPGKAFEMLSCFPGSWSRNGEGNKQMPKWRKELKEFVKEFEKV